MSLVETRLDRAADALVHAIGLTLGIGACTTLAIAAFASADALRCASLCVYGLGLAAMLGFSALANVAETHRWSQAFERLDRAAIFVMIAGTYTPFTLALMGGTAGYGLFGFVWTIAGLGAAVQIAAPARLRRFGVALYLLLGWSVVAALGPLIRAMSVQGFVLLCAGGVLYSIGVIVYLWPRLACRRAIWHVFVLAAAACHFAAVMTDVAGSGHEPIAALIRASASGESHSAGPVSVPISQPLPSMRSDVGSPTTLPAVRSV
jgi:hemolysin III